MSKRRSVILSVMLEGKTQAETARLYGLSEATVSRWIVRYRAEGTAAFAPKSRRPKTSPTKVSDVVNKLIVNLRVELDAQGLDAGPETIEWHLKTHHQIDVSVSTIRRRLVAAGLVVAEPRKRPKSSYIRFEADLPNGCWQTDMTHYRLATSEDTEILSWLDDHSRYALNVTAHHRVNGPAVVDTFDETADQHGYPASVLSDNGMYYTARFARGGNSGPNRFERHLINLGVNQKHSRPNHPTTCGKVERFQQTLKKWLRAQQHQPETIDQLQTLLNQFVDLYNNERPHRSLNRATPAAAYKRLPKAEPGDHTNQTYRIRHDTIDKGGTVTLRHEGQLHHIGIGRGHKHTKVVLLIDNLNIRIIATQTGELLRQLTLDTSRDYQPQNARNPNR